MAMTSTPREAEVATAGRSEFAVEIEGLHKWFGEFYVLRDVDLQVRRGERIVICGPSGSGKSTLLRCINGLEPYQRGEVTVDGLALANDPKRIVQVRREVGMVFQQFNLFPHLTVLENCTLAPIHVRKIQQGEAEASARRFLDRVRIPSRPANIPASCRAGSSSASRSRALSA